MRIVDSHFHVWRQEDLPWLKGPMQPRIFGPYEPIRRDYPIEEYRLDAAGTGVEAAVYVQANWAPGRAEDEVAWVSREADRTGWPHGIIGYCDLTISDPWPELKRLLAFPRLRGIRQQLHWHENPLYRFAPHPDIALDPTFQRNVARLADHGLAFDLQVFPGQFDGACALADACPGVTFVLQHAGMPEDLSDAGWASWRAGLARLAARPNMTAKLSGLGTFLRRLDPGHIARVTSETLARFGPERCLFGSNFPIEKLWTDYAALVSAHERALEEIDEAGRAAVLAGTARRIYRL